MKCICGAEIVQHDGKGRPAKFCSERCRVRAHRANRANNVTPIVTKIKGPVRPPFSWFGGKRQLAPVLSSLLPVHQVYVEVFGGSGALLFHKRPSDLEVYNDLDSGLVNFFSVLKDSTRSQELQRLLRLTLYSREEWNICRQTWQEMQDPIEQARRWYVALQQSFSSHFDQNGWSFTKSTGHNPAQTWVNTIADLPAVTKRLAHVQIEHMDYAKLLATYDSPDTCFYLDPPYLPETRRRHGYRCELTREDHEQMLAQVDTLQGKVVLSGYESDLYNDALAGWECIKIPVLNVSSNTEREKRTECIWLSPNIQRQPTLWQEVI